MAVMTIINSYLPIMTMSVYSVSQAVQPIIGFNYGAKNFRRVKKTLMTAINAGIVLSFVFWIIVMMFPKQLILFFNEKSTPEALREGVKAIRIYFSFVIISSFGITVPNYFQATGRSKYSVTLNLLRQVVIFLLVVIIFSNIWKLDGIWLAQPFTDLLFFIILLGFLYKEKKFFDKMNENENNRLEYNKQPDEKKDKK